MASLQLGMDLGSTLVPGPSQEAGSATGTVTNPVTDPQAQNNTEPNPLSANVHTGTPQDANQTASSVPPAYDVQPLPFDSTAATIYLPWYH